MGHYPEEKRLECFRQPCCRGDAWRNKVVVGVLLNALEWVDFMGKIADAPMKQKDFWSQATQESIEAAELELAQHGFPVKPEVYFVLNDCASCT